MITLVNINVFSPNLLCALIFERSGLGLLMSKFRQILIELSARDIFTDDNLSKCQGILTKLGTYIDNRKIRFGIANGRISSILTELSARDPIMAGYYRLTFLFVKSFLRTYRYIF